MVDDHGYSLVGGICSERFDVWMVHNVNIRQNYQTEPAIKQTLGSVQYLLEIHNKIHRWMAT